MSIDADIAVCADCGYDLADIDFSTDWACPECGGRASRSRDLTGAELVDAWVRGFVGSLSVAVAIGIALLFAKAACGACGLYTVGNVDVDSILLWCGVALFLVVLPCCMVWCGLGFAGGLPRAARSKRKRTRRILIGSVAASIAMVPMWAFFAIIVLVFVLASNESR
ncbi:MAG: hypothetical protein AAGK04_05360 [Planctomycetota bacterium]